MVPSIKYVAGDFHKFLVEYKTLPTGAFSHTSLGDPMGSYYIPIEKEDEFFKLYSNSLKQGENLYLTEKHKILSPILLDFDFRYHIDNDLKRIYTESHISEIVKEYVNILNEYFETENVKIYIFEKNNPTVYKDNIAKDGIHIIIPEIVTKSNVQYIIRDKFIQKMGNYFKDIGFVNEIEDIFDRSVIENNNWFMYGSTKPNCQIYKVTKILKINKDENSETTITQIGNAHKNLLESIKLFSIRNKYNEKNIKTEKQIEIFNYDQNIINEAKHKEILLQATRKSINMNKRQCDNIELVRKFVTILDIHRANQYDSWIRLGWCLRTIDTRLLDSWVEFSRKSDKYCEGECEKLWDKMRDSGLSIGTLRMWAKQDNLHEYNEIIRNDWRKFLHIAVSKTDYDLAKVVFNMFKYDYICSNIKLNTWYEFRNHRWELIDSGYTLRAHLSTDVVKEFYKVIVEFNTKILQEDDPDEQARLQEKINKFIKVINDLKSTSKKNNIIKECAEMFYCEKFEEKLDSNVNLVGFKNGVYDLELMEFREGRPDDFISFCTNINYYEYDENNPQNEDIMRFARQVIPNEGVLDYLMKCFASFLNGKNKEEKFHIWLGVGSNGKSKFIDLFTYAFGDYCGTFNVSLLTQKRIKSGDTNSELVKAKGKRFMVLQEPEGCERLNVGIMKELTGGDTVQARGLFKEPIQFKPQFKLILTCNDLPVVPANDNGTWRRVRACPFTSVFTDNPNPDNPHEFKLDNELVEKLDNWKESFMSILITYYRKYLITGIVEPEEVIACTEKYRRENDCYSEFINSKIEDDPKSSVNVKDVYDEFKYYYKETMPASKTPSMPDFKKGLERKFGTVVKNKWIGIRLITSDRDENKCNIDTNNKDDL